MPHDCDLPAPDQLSSFSESVTLPYEELKELKAAAAAVGSKTGLSVMPDKDYILQIKTFKKFSVILCNAAF